MAEKTFEGSLARLEEIVKLLERGEVPLGQSIKLFEEGTKLSASLSTMLARAEQKVTMMKKTAEGEVVEVAVRQVEEDENAE